MFGMPELASNITGAGMIFSIGWQLVGWVRERRDKRDGRQEKYVELSQKFEGEGLTMCSKFLMKLGVGNYRGAYTAADEALEMMKDDTKRNAHFDQVVLKRLPAMLKDPDRRLPLVKAYEGFRKGDPVVAADIRKTIDEGNASEELVKKVAAQEEKVAVLEAKVNGGKPAK